VLVGPKTKYALNSVYFPEKYLTQWYQETQNKEFSIYTFPRSGPEVIKDILERIIQKHNIDLIIGVDGGTDSLMRGDEPELGTPEEDLSTLCAMSSCQIDQILVTTVFGVDSYHGVQHYYFLKGVAELSQNGGFFGVESLLPSSKEAKLYIDVLNYIHNKMPAYKSIVSTCLMESLQAKFGEIKLPVAPRSAQSFITPLSSMYWYFDAKKVTERCMYIKRIQGLKLYSQVVDEIDKFRQNITIQPAKTIDV
jgi:hypothetical protein